MRRPTMVLAVGLLCLIWGSTWLVIKVGLEALPPFFGAACRFALAAAILFIVGRLQRIPFPRSLRAHLGLLGIGLFGIGVSYGAVYWGEQYIPSGLSAVLFATHPLFVMLLAHRLIAAEPVSARKVVGVVLGFAGVVLIFQADLRVTHPRGLAAAVVTLLSPVAASASNVAIKRWASHFHPYNLTTLPMAYGALMLGAIALATEDPAAVRWTPEAAGSVVYLALFGSVIAFVVYYSLLKQVAVSLLALLSYAYPVVAVTLGYAILGETLEPAALAGGLAIVAGIAVASTPQRTAAQVTCAGRGLSRAKP